jgi:hypothetical protein
MVSAYYQKRTGKLRLLFWGELFNLLALILLLIKIQVGFMMGR